MQLDIINTPEKTRNNGIW